MAMGYMMRPEQPDSQIVGPSGLGDPSETVPEEVLEVWASLPHCECQLSCRPYFHDQAAAASAALLSTIDACVHNIGSALAEFLHATAASILVPPSQFGMKHTHEDAGLPSFPVPTSTSSRMISDNSQAEKHCSDTLPPSLPALNVSTLTTLCAADELMAELTAELTPTTATSQLEPTAAMLTGQLGAAVLQAAATLPTAAVLPQPDSDSLLSQPHF